MMKKNENVFKHIEGQELTAKAFGFYWEKIEQLLEQIRSECEEVDESWKKDDRRHLQEEVGDLIHATISLAIFCQLDPEETLRKSVEKFQKRYDALVEFAKKDGHVNLLHQPSDVLLHYWKLAKNQQKGDANV